MNRPWCNCHDQGTCIGCMIEQKLNDRETLRELIVSHYFGTEGLSYYQSHMQEAIFVQEHPDLFEDKAK